MVVVEKEEVRQMPQLCSKSPYLRISSGDCVDLTLPILLEFLWADPV